MLDKLITSAKSIGVVAHDAGGANLLAALISQFSDVGFKVFARGPATQLLTLKNVQTAINEKEFFSGIDFVLLGTGHGYFEKKALRYANVLNLQSAVILDHFVNYRARFVGDDGIVFPDYCFVCDEYSLNLAKAELAPFNRIYLCDNYLVADMRKKIEATSTEKNSSILYVLENIQEIWDEKLNAWELAFKNFYTNFCPYIEFDSIIVRPHPSDDPLIYQSLLNFEHVVFDFNKSPIDSLSKAKAVVGVESYLLYLSHCCGYTVYTSLPPNIRRPRLPSHVYKVFN